MKAFLKRLTFLIIFILAIGFGICVYLLQAPPVEQKAVPKLQIHTRTALRGRPTVDSKPIVYTKDVYRFSLDQQYISNLNSGKLERELLFAAGLSHRARLKAERLDASLKTATGAAYTVVKTDSNVEVYLPDLREAFEANKISLSKDLKTSIKQANRRWLIEDKEYKQAYSVVNGEGKLNIFQQSKFEILTFLFEADIASQSSLAQGKLSAELIKEFIREKIPLSRRARVSASEDGIGWQVTNPPLKYNIRSENNRLKVYLDLESKWLRIKVDDSTKGWVQSERGTIFEPPPPTLSSRQQVKERLLVLIDKLKERVGLSDG